MYVTMATHSPGPLSFTSETIRVTYHERGHFVESRIAQFDPSTRSTNVPSKGEDPQCPTNLSGTELQLQTPDPPDPTNGQSIYKIVRVYLDCYVPPGWKKSSSKTNLKLCEAASSNGHCEHSTDHQVELAVDDDNEDSFDSIFHLSNGCLLSHWKNSTEENIQIMLQLWCVEISVTKLEYADFILSGGFCNQVPTSWPGMTKCPTVFVRLAYTYKRSDSKNSPTNKKSSKDKDPSTNPTDKPPIKGEDIQKSLKKFWPGYNVILREPEEQLF